MKITFIRSNTNAVGEYRVHHPALALTDLGHDCRMITLDREGVRTANAELAVDVLVLQRQTSLSVLKLRDTLPPERRPATVYEVDDNPWEWHSWDPVHRSLGHDYGKQVRAVMAQCDAITCSTLTLAERVRREFPQTPVWVVPNAIDYQFRDWQAVEDRAEHGLADRIVLGWTGSIHHVRDGGPLLQALPQVLDRYPEAVFLMQCDQSVYSAWTKGLAAAGYGDRLRWIPPMLFTDHPRVYSLFDVNLAPLEITPFNLCKSDLRLIEGGARGVPYVASKIAPYLEFHRQSDGIGGHLAGTVGEWVEGISKLIDREDVGRGDSLSRYVRETRSLSVVAGQWQTALQGAKDNLDGMKVQAREKPTRNTLCPCGSGIKYKRCHEPAYG